MISRVVGGACGFIDSLHCGVVIMMGFGRIDDARKFASTREANMRAVTVSRDVRRGRGLPGLFFLAKFRQATPQTLCGWYVATSVFHTLAPQSSPLRIVFTIPFSRDCLQDFRIGIFFNASLGWGKGAIEAIVIAVGVKGLWEWAQGALGFSRVHGPVIRSG